MARLAFLICLAFLLVSPAGAAEPPAPPSPMPPIPGEKAPPETVNHRGAQGPREILLTFDDGPRLDLTPKVLDMLDARGIKSVFFVNGWRFAGKSAGAEQARALLRDMVHRGHLVGNHTVHHYFLCGQRGPKIALQEIEENADLIEQAIGMRPLLFRTPYGSHCKTLSATLHGLGIKPIAWDIDPQDWRLRNADKVLAYMQQSLRRLRGRSIVLFHDVQPATVAALPRLLDWIDEENGRRRTDGQPEIKIIDYSYLLPDRPLVPPVIDGLGRILVEAVRSWPIPLSALQPLRPGA